MTNHKPIATRPVDTTYMGKIQNVSFSHKNPNLGRYPLVVVGWVEGPPIVLFVRGWVVHQLSCPKGGYQFLNAYAGNHSSVVRFISTTNIS